MSVDPTIYLSRPDLIGWLEQPEETADFEAAIKAVAEKATDIVVLGGFVSTSRLLGLFEAVRTRTRRRTCRVRIVIGLDEPALLPRLWTDLQTLDGKLRQLGFRDVEVRVLRGTPVHFHTKLYRIRRGNQPTWFVGSANPGSLRHELMVRISGGHVALNAYVKAVIKEATLVVQRAATPSVRIDNFRDFILAGFLCHTPPARPTFTVDVFQLRPEERNRLAAGAVAAGGIRHARPRTEGFGFGLASALEVGDLEEEVEANAPGRLRLRPLSIATDFGAWVPRAYRQEVEATLRDQEGERLQRLLRLNDVLSREEGHDRAHDAFAEYVADMEAALRQHGIEGRSPERREATFRTFLAARARMVGNADERRRLAQKRVLVDMPDFWSDERAVERFMTSFLEDIVWRLDRASLRDEPADRILRVINRELNGVSGQGTEAVWKLLETRLRRGWEDGDWRA